jgi:3-mercaptopyruvate sulfurtransferase SseA
VALTDLGHRGLRVYDGSWSEWSADPDNPTEANVLDAGSDEEPS